jgi:hypothetical protein
MYKKTLFAAAILALTTATAHAQLNGAAPAQAAASAAASAPAAPVAAPASSAPAHAPAAALQGVNPFTGKSQNLEARQRALEVAKMETALLEEQLKQAALSEDLVVMPLKKQVETAQATTARMKEELAQKEVIMAPKLAAIQAANAQKALNPMPLPAEAKAKPKTRPVKVKPVAEAAPVKPVVAPVPAPRIEVSTIMNFGGTRAAVLDIDNNILTVKHGDNTPVGMVEIIDDQSVRVGGRAYKVHGATLARVVISDPKPVDPKAPVMAPAMPAAPAAAATAPSAVFPGPLGNLPPGRNGQPSLPPLQLPAGVTLLPATAR